MRSSRTLPIELAQATIAFATRLGWDVNSLLAEGGISPALLAEGRARVTEEQTIKLVQGLWRSTNDELFGLGPYPLHRGSFRLMCYALLGSADLSEVLDRLQGFLQAMPALPVTIELGKRDTAITIRNLPEHPGEPVAVLFGLASAHRLLSWLIGRNIRPIRAELAFPESARLESFNSFFDGQLVFDAEQSRLIFASRWLGLPVMRREQEIDDFVRESPRALLRQPGFGKSVADQVRRLLHSGIVRGELLRADDVAKRLAVSPQTLRRRLAESGTSVRQLSGEVRRDVAVASLVEGKESIADLSRRLGFSEASAFTRAFREWTGSTPSEYRRKVAS